MTSLQDGGSSKRHRKLKIQFSALIIGTSDDAIHPNFAQFSCTLNLTLPGSSQSKNPEEILPSRWRQQRHHPEHFSFALLH
jgi:hypothetical protein